MGEPSVRYNSLIPKFAALNEGSIHASSSSECAMKAK